MFGQAEVDPEWAAQIAGDKTLLTTTQLLSFAFQVANGMHFLSEKTVLVQSNY
jgi:hypothetical protein